MSKKNVVVIINALKVGFEPTTDVTKTNIFRLSPVYHFQHLRLKLYLSSQTDIVSILTINYYK